MQLTFVLISTKPENLENLPESLKEIDAVEVEEVYMVYGVYDFVAKVKANNIAELDEIVTYHLRRLGKVLSITTMIVMRAQRFARSIL